MMLKWILVLALTLGWACGAGANPDRVHYKAIRATEQVQPERAFVDMLELAQGGFAPAMNRVGFYYRQGLGTAANLDKAGTWYRRAIVAGHPWSSAALARVEMARGDGAAALAVLETATVAGHPGAERLLATAHIDRALGGASDPVMGQAMLIALFDEGDALAARELLQRHNWKRLHGHARQDVVRQVVERGLAGDPRDAGAALTYLTQEANHSDETIRIRARLLAVPGLRTRK